TPLKKFRAHFDGYDVQPRKGQFAKEGQQDVLCSFSKLVVIESDSPYPYEVAKIILKFSDAMSSGWCILEDSIANILGKSTDEVSIDDLVNADVTWEREDNHLFFTDKAGKESRGTVWRVTEVGGMAAGVSPFDKALELLEGKGVGEFTGEAVANPIVQKDGTLVNSILGGAFFEDQRVKDAYNLVNDVYVKKV
ncbi:unnamed protein product, partial [marine sediment metagenome]